MGAEGPLHESLVSSDIACLHAQFESDGQADQARAHVAIFVDQVRKQVKKSFSGIEVIEVNH